MSDIQPSYLSERSFNHYNELRITPVELEETSCDDDDAPSHERQDPEPVFDVKAFAHIFGIF